MKERSLSTKMERRLVNMNLLSRKNIYRFFISALVAGLFFCLLNYLVVNKYQAKIFTEVTEVPARLVALVLGAGLRKDGSPSTVLEDRVRTAVDLYQAGKVEKILMSGDNGSIYYDEVTVMKKMAVEMGVPKEAVALDYAGFRTYDSCYRAHDVFELNNIILITQDFHLPRALYLCNKLGVAAIGVPADRHVYVKQNLWQVREAIARFFAFFEVNIFRHQPKFLGPKESIWD